MARIPIPRKLQNRLYYESQYACVVCQDTGSHIHHIDKDASNNSEDNLVVLCMKHHDEAHTKKELSKNLDSRALRDAKRRWLSEVERSRIQVSSLSGQKYLAGNDPLFASGMSWGYINHKRIAQMTTVSRLTGEAKRTFDYCIAAGLVDHHGIIIKPKNLTCSNSYISNTLYDWFEYGDDHRLHVLYSAMVDQLVNEQNVIHISPRCWSKTAFKSLVSPGSLMFVNKAFYFKVISEDKLNQHRLCRTFRRNIEIRFYVDSMDMFGTTSITVSFSGHKTCAALVLVKSIEQTSEGKLLVHCTPIALGIGFRKKEY